MPAGTNCRVRAWRLVEYDDDVGGSIPSGTILHDSLEARIDQDLIDSGFYQQGLETKKTFSGMVWGHQLQVLEQDELEVVSPPNHKYYGKKFRVVEARYDSRHPAIKQNYLLVKLTRSQVAHSEPYQ